MSFTSGILSFVIAGIILVSVTAYIVKGATTSPKYSAYMTLVDQKVSLSDYKDFKDKVYEKVIKTPSSTCEVIMTSCKYEWPTGVNAKADLNGDGKVDMTDVNIILRLYGCKSTDTCWNNPVEDCFFTLGDRKFKDPAGGLYATGFSDCKMNQTDLTFVTDTNRYGHDDPNRLSSNCRNDELCRADINQDGKVDLYDAVIVSRFSGEYAEVETLLSKGSMADTDGDGKIFLTDAVVVLGNYGQTVKPKCETCDSSSCETSSLEQISSGQYKAISTGATYDMGFSYICY